MVERKRKLEKALDKHNVITRTAFPPSSKVEGRIQPNVLKMISGTE
jgi:hypothetical protein